MGHFQKKPVVIEAVCFNGVEIVDETDSPMFDGSFCPPQPWLQDALALHENKVGAVYAEGSVLKIHTLEGVMTAAPGDWVIRGVKGELYPCKPDIFAATYELVQP